MRPSIFIFQFILLFCLPVYSQSPDSGKVEVIRDPRMNIVLDKWQQSVETADGKIEGYRVQIHFGVDKTVAKDIKAKFLLKYPAMSAYELYDQPNFKIRVGDFRSKLEAHKAMKEISPEFPGCFIVQDKIELPKVE